VPPALLQFVEAPYPEAAFAKGITASVMTTLFIDETGKVVQVELAQPLEGDAANQGFEDAALKALSAFTFSPALVDGVPTPVKVQYRYDFVINIPEPDPIPDEVDPAPVDRSTLPVNLVIELRERGTRKPLDRAAVTLVKGDETIDDYALDGRYEAHGLSPGEWTIIIDADGYEPVSLTEEVFEGKRTEASYYIERTYYDVFDGKGDYKGDSDYVFETTSARVKREVSVQTLSVAEVQRIPGNQGDAIKVVQNLPGVARAPFGGGQIVIRGSAPEDSEILLDGSPIPLLFHFGGLSAVINSDILEEIQFIPGNFSVRYGRAIGGIVDVKTRRPNSEKYSGYINVDLLNTVALFEGPVGGGWAVQASARRSYIDAILPLVIPDDAPASLTTAPRYWDYQMRANWGSEKTINGEPVHEVELFSFGSDDVLEVILKEPSANNPGVRGNASTATNFHRGQARWIYRSKKLRNSLLYNFGGNALGFALSDTAYFKLNVFDHVIRDELNYEVADWLTLTGGLDMRFGNFDISVLAPRPPQEGEVGQGFNSSEFISADITGSTYRPATFAEASISPTEDLLFVLGTRVDYDRSIRDFSNDIRGSFRYQFAFDYDCQPLDDDPEAPCQAIPWRWAIKGGVGTFHQTPEDNESSIDFGNPDLTFQSAVHYTLGFETSVPTYEALFFDITGFYKSLSDMIAPSDRLIERDGETVPERLANTGIGNIWGGEFLIRHNLSNNFFGWISYTLSFSERQDAPEEPVRLFSFDQTHILTIIGSYKLPDNWQVGLRWRYTTGNPTTPRSRGVYLADADDYEAIPGETNSTRIPPFHQLDFRVDKTWIFDTWVLNAYLDIQNVYYNANPEGVTYNFDFTQSGITEGLPILPSFGVRGQF
jgi:TonB family protein